MDLIEFPEQTVVYAKDQPEYLPLPAHVYPGDPYGRIVCCWRLTWRERMSVLIHGLVWHQVMTFNQPLQPQLLLVEKPDRGAAATPRPRLSKWRVQRDVLRARFALWRGRWRARLVAAACWWFGCIPDYHHSKALAPDCVPCKRCGAPDTSFSDRVGDTRHARAAALACGLWRRLFPTPCPDCGRRYGTHEHCDQLPF